MMIPAPNKLFYSFWITTQFKKLGVPRALFM